MAKRWSTRNLGDVDAVEHRELGKAFLFGESRPGEHYRDVGVNIRVLDPGQPAALYHAEDTEEFFIVLGGECVAIVEDEEVALRRWDYVVCPPGTAHVLVGASETPATVLMIGGRGPERRLRYPPSEAAARYGASVTRATTDPQDAWQQVGWDLRFASARLPWPPAQ